MASIKFGLWDVTLHGLVDDCQCSMLKEHAACIRQEGIKTWAAHEPLGTLQTLRHEIDCSLNKCLSHWPGRPLVHFAHVFFSVFGCHK